MLKIPSLINKFCDAVWEYDVKKKEVFVHYDDMTPDICGRWISYEKIEEMYRERYVYPLDLEIWEHFLSVEGLKRFAEGKGEEDHFCIRFEHTQKGTEWHEVYLQRIEEHRVLLASRDIKEKQRNATIAQAIVPEFDYVCCIDLAMQSYVLYYSDENKTVVPQTASDNYHKILEEFNRCYVVPEEQEELTKRMQLENVLKELEKKDEYILYATVIEHNSLSYKKLRFSYENEKREKLLLTRTDIGELVGERKLKEKEREKRLQYLQNMPVAFCSTKILLDEKDKPYDFQFTYCNRAHEILEGVKEGELLGKNFYEFFHESDPKWLEYYYETAYNGINHVIRRYSPEIQKHLLIYTFQSEVGYCECVLIDESEQYFLTQELKNSRADMRRLLENLTELSFQYHPEKEEIILDERKNGEASQGISRNDLLQKIVNDNLLDTKYQEKLEESFQRMKEGEHAASVLVRGKIHAEDEWKWYRVTMFDFFDVYTHERKVLGFLQNIDQDMSKEEELRKKAETDLLTGVLNSGTGREEIRKKLARKSDEDDSYNVMILIDLDDFKIINDTHGHFVGDQVLTEFAQVLRKTFRADDVVCRLGGDEFVVFAERIREIEQKIDVILYRLHQQMDEARKKYPFLRCSIGVFATNKQYSFEEYYVKADQALYEAKHKGKGDYVIRKED